MNRQNRLHVKNVRIKTVKEGKGIEGIQATIVLTEEVGMNDTFRLGDIEMSWENWISGGREAIIKGEW